MKIPVPSTLKFDYGGYTIHTIYGQKPKYYKQALWSTLEHLKPKYCLEIGTYQFGTAEVFQEYFNQYEPNGKLITCDIYKWCDKPKHLTNVEFLQVYPHWTDHYIETWGREGLLLPNWRDHLFTSIQDNIDLIVNAFGISNFCGVDLTFIDGDHRAICLAKDFEMAKELAGINNPAILLEDIDIEELKHESSAYYHNIIKQQVLDEGGICYDFDDWNICTNCALVSGFNDGL
jgi:hypothetical protein